MEFTFDYGYIKHSNGKITFNGNLTNRTMVNELEICLNILISKIKEHSVITIDLVSAEDCSSFLFKVILQWAGKFPESIQKFQLFVAKEDGDIIPWHDFFVNYMKIRYFFEIDVVEVEI